MTDQSSSPTQSMQLFNSMTGTLDFRVEYFDKKLVSETFSTDQFLQYQEYTIFWLRGGKGRYQVDFQHYDLENDEIYGFV